MSEDLQKKLDELGLDQTARQAVASVGGYVAAREDRILDLIERAAGQIDERTEHRYTGTIDKVRSGLLLGVSRLAEQQQPAGDPSENPSEGDGPDARQ